MSDPVLQVRDLSVTHMVSRGLFRRKHALNALRNVSMSVAEGEAVAIVGESGSGKTTLAMSLLNLVTPTNGEVLYRGRPLSEIGRREVARKIQPVFQDPYSSLNPRRTIASIIAQPLAIHGIGGAAERRKRAVELMDLVGLPRRFAGLLPHQLSGGQRQRVAIARALVMRPDILLCDEPTSALDVSVQAQILNLLADLRKELGLTFILITHNLAVVEYFADRVMVMYLGQAVEEASVSDLFSDPGHPYTRSLLASVLTPDPALRLPDVDLETQPANPLDPPSGCHFHPRCVCRFDPCAVHAPHQIVRRDGSVRCHLFDREHAGHAASALP
jgi:peptide/nickel transport system ATP-binding protein